MIIEDFKKHCIDEVYQFVLWLEMQGKAGENHSYEEWLDLWNDKLRMETEDF